MTSPQRVFTLVAILGAAGLWLLLPRGTRRGTVVGALLSTAALILMGMEVPRLKPWLGDAAFIFLAGVTVCSAAVTISLANPVYCAIWFGMSLMGTASLFLYQGAQFLAVAIVVVYAGAILVTFLFVLMLAQPQGRAPYDRVSWEALISAATGAVMLGMLGMILYQGLGNEQLGTLAAAPPEAAKLQEGVLNPDHVVRLGMELFGRHLLAVEVAGMLLLAALVGVSAIVIQGRAAADAAASLPQAPKS